MSATILLIAWSWFASCDTASISAEHRYEMGDDSGAVRQLEQIQASDPNCAESEWRMAYVRLAEANHTTDPDKRKILWTIGRNLADHCVAKHPQSGGSWFVSALSLGVESTFAGSHRRVELSKTLHERIARSLELDPNLPGTWYLLARWHEGLCSLSFAERGFANLLLGGLPRGASEDSARIYLRKSLALRPNTPIVLLDLAQNLERAGRHQEALEVCRRAKDIPQVERDKRSLEAISSLRQKLEHSGS